MKEIKAFKCDHCKKILLSKSGIYKHESICFWNTATKSCITCEGLELKYCLNGKSITEEEEMILQFKIDGTYHTCTWYMEADFNELNDEYRYLYDAEIENYCSIKKVILKKLTSRCDFHKIKLT